MVRNLFGLILALSVVSCTSSKAPPYDAPAQQMPPEDAAPAPTNDPATDILATGCDTAHSRS